MLPPNEELTMPYVCSVFFVSSIIFLLKPPYVDEVA